jgi:hypothetical protein
MEELYTFSKYFPLKISEPNLARYLEHHLEHLINCGESGYYSSAFSHLHIVYMIFVYIQLLRIAKEKSQEFEFCWIGFPNQEKEFLKNPSSPFSFSKINEKTVFRFFRLVGFDDGSIGDISGLVNKRNKHLHANGNIFFEQKEDFLEEIELYESKFQCIVEKQRKFLESIYDPLVENYEEGYVITSDELESDFADQYFFSEYELKLLSFEKTDCVSTYINNEM